MSLRFDAGILERQFAILDRCPEKLLQQAITLPVGSLEERIAGIEAWRNSLLTGVLPPDEAVWPSGQVGKSIRRALAALDIARFCQDESELTDALMFDILEAIGRGTTFLHDKLEERLRELEALERDRNQSGRRRRNNAANSQLPDDVIRRLTKRAQEEAERMQIPEDPAFEEVWGERVRAWSALADVFGDLGALLGRGWDLALGVLRSVGWRDLVQTRALLEQLPQLTEVVRSLGMLQATEDEESTKQSVFESIRRIEEELHEERTPYVPIEVRGIVRSAEVSRMLPAEAALLGHPKLRVVWHARRAERALLTYKLEGIEVSLSEVESSVAEEQEEQHPRPHRGPIVAVVDTSGSMHGAPEQVAKALVLEALRVAHAEKRECYLFAYSGPGDVVEHRLDLSPKGIGALLSFLQWSFGGGTDLGVMKSVVEHLTTEEWRKADVLLVTDGEWEAPPEVLQIVDDARDRYGSRFHGLQIGNVGTTGLHRLCNPVHVFRDWRHAGGWR